MKTNNPVLDTIVESQSQFINNWMESAKKMQSAFSNGSITSEGQSLYKEYFDKQMNLFNNLQNASLNVTPNTNPQDFFKNWFNQQATYAKQMGDFAQSLQSSMMNFGKPANDYMSNFGQSNTAFTNIYNSWLQAINSSYETMSRSMNGTFNKDVFSNFMQGNQIFAKMQQFFQPMTDAMQKGQFNADAFKQFYNTESYSQLAKQMFGNMFDNANVKDAFDSGIKKLHEFFVGQNNLTKEYYAQMQSVSANFPSLFSANGESLKDFYSQAGQVFGKTFEPLLKLVNAGKEKESAEATIALMDKLAAYTVKQAELQAFLANTARASVEKIAEQYAEKFKENKTPQIPTAQELYSEWVKVNEQLFTELFASDEFSKVKGETINLNMELKKHFESQFESAFSHLPFVFKSESDELTKTIHDLKRQVRELQSKLAMAGAEDEATAKPRKKH